MGMSKTTSNITGRARPITQLEGPPGGCVASRRRLGVPRRYHTRHFAECIPCGRVDTAIGFVSFENVIFRNRKRACCVSASTLTVRSPSKTHP